MIEKTFFIFSWTNTEEIPGTLEKCRYVIIVSLKRLKRTIYQKFRSEIFNSLQLSWNFSPVLFFFYSQNTSFYIVFSTCLYTIVKTITRNSIFRKDTSYYNNNTFLHLLKEFFKKRKKKLTNFLRYAIITGNKSKRLSGENSIFEQTFLRVTVQLTSISRIRRNTKNAWEVHTTYTQRTHNGRLPISSFGTRAGNWRKKREKFFRINAPKKTSISFS